ncbi:MAG: DUF3185 family protein [Planctomycetes bacterium]|nr:DUF3185 family protein [Planctomycetota bacterium]
MRSLLVALVLLAAGITLLVWGFSASDSLSSQTSQLFQGAPSNKAMALMVSGGVIAALGLLSMLRRPTT